MIGSLLRTIPTAGKQNRCGQRTSGMEEKMAQKLSSGQQAGASENILDAAPRFD